MLSRLFPVSALCVRGVRSFYGKTFPDHTLKFVQVFHRHGDRTPLHNYFVGTKEEKEEEKLWKQLIPNKDQISSTFSVYKNQCIEPNEPCDPIFGQLTTDGIKQMQDVGLQLRKLYFEEEPLLNDDSYDSSLVSLRTTCRDRTLHSLYSLLSTLFPIKEKKKSHPVIAMIPDDSCCLNKYDRKCKVECRKRLSSYDWVEYLDHMNDVYLPTVVKALPYFADEKKMKWTRVMDYVLTRYSHLFEIDKDIYDIFPDIYRHNMNKFDLVYNTLKCLKSFTDELFEMIETETNDVIIGKKQTRLSIYSCHDTSILPLLNVLTPFKATNIPPYAANICIEYWQSDFDKSIDVAVRYNGKYEPVFIEHYVGSILVKYVDFCKTLSIPKYLLDVMRNKNRVDIITEAK